jgi:DNA-directed RNA polymerase specialized sigma24 family protein
MPSSPILSVELNGARVGFRTYEEVENWLSIEYGAWSWLLNLPQDLGGVAEVVRARHQELIGEIRTARARGQELQSVSNFIGEYFRDNRNDGLIYSDSRVGRVVQSIAETRGPAAGAFALGFSQRRLLITQARNPEEFAAAVMIALPDLQPSAEIAHRLGLERQNTRNALTSALEKIQSASDAREADWQDLRRILRRRYLGWLQRVVRRIATLEKAHTDSAEAAVEAILATDTAYKEAMSLQAPVEYWNKKASNHEAKERDARTRLVWFFSLLIPAMSAMFCLAGWFVLLEQKAAPQLYIVAGAGLATVTGTLFWVGRLLTRLYLSEHHLRHDAEERAVMTKTYLALTHSNAAQDTDRQIVLTALFRSTPDGIVKDDGPPDANVAALISRLAGGKV